MTKVRFLPVVILLLFVTNVYGQETVLDYYVPTDESIKYLSCSGSDKMILKIGYTDNGPLHQKIEATYLKGRMFSSTAKLYQVKENKIYIRTANIESVMGNEYKDFGFEMIELVLPPNPTATISWKTIDMHEKPINCVASFKDLIFNGRTVKAIKVVTTQKIGNETRKTILYYGYHLGYMREDAVESNGKVNTVFLMKE